MVLTGLFRQHAIYCLLASGIVDLSLRMLHIFKWFPFQMTSLTLSVMGKVKFKRSSKCGPHLGVQ